MKICNIWFARTASGAKTKMVTIDRVTKKNVFYRSDDSINSLGINFFIENYYPFPGFEDHVEKLFRIQEGFKKFYLVPPERELSVYGIWGNMVNDKCSSVKVLGILKKNDRWSVDFKGAFPNKETCTKFEVFTQPLEHFLSNYIPLDQGKDNSALYQLSLCGDIPITVKIIETERYKNFESSNSSFDYEPILTDEEDDNDPFYEPILTDEENSVAKFGDLDPHPHEDDSADEEDDEEDDEYDEDVVVKSHYFLLKKNKFKIEYKNGDIKIDITGSSPIQTTDISDLIALLDKTIDIETSVVNC